MATDKLCSTANMQYSQIIKIITIRTMSKKPPVIDVDPATLLFIGCLLILLPLIVTGFLAQ